MKILKILKYFANTIRAIFGYIVIIIVAIFVIKLVKYFDKLYDNKPITQIYYKPTYRPEPDTIIRWLEKIKQVKVEPEIIHDTVYYDVMQNHLIKMLKADGKKITIQTQYCGQKSGKEFIYPYTELFQVVPSDDGMNFIKYRDYWDWDKLNISINYQFIGETEIKLYSSLQFNPWDLKIQPYISNNSTGIEFRKKLW